MSSDPLLAPVRGVFRAVARATVPAAAELDEAAWTAGEAVVEQALSDRPAAVRRQVILFFRMLDALSWLRFGGSLTRLPVERARRLLATLERSHLLLLRRGAWGVRTLTFMAVYGQASVRRSLGYRAAPAGWEARGGNQGPWPDREGAAPPERGVLVAPPPDDAHA